MTDVFARLDQHLRAGEHRRARGEANQLLSGAPSSGVCQAIAARLDRLDPADADLTPVRIALLSNFTIDPLVPILRARALLSGLHVQCYVPGYDLWQQEVIGEGSGLRAFAPDVIVFDLHPQQLLPALFDDPLAHDADGIDGMIASTAERLATTWATLRRWSQAKIIVHTMAAPGRRPLGIVDSTLPAGLTAALTRLNARLADLCRAVADAYVLDIAPIVDVVGAAAWMDRRLWALARLPYAPAALHAIADEQLRFIRAFAGRVRKVLALDLDGTLWGGIAGEDGANGLQLGPDHPGSAYLDVQRAARELQRRGVLLAINSKNSEDEALAIIDAHPSMLLRRDAFAAIRINWRDKADNLIELARELGLGLDSFVFVDDSAAECERVRRALPEVLTVHLTGEPAAWGDVVRGLGVFDALSYGTEDRQRAELYRTEARRQTLERQAVSVEEFYDSLRMRLHAERVGARTLDRAAELTQRTNQFNLTTRRLTRSAIDALASRPDVDPFIFRLEDAFGDYGFIGLAILEYAGASAVLTSFLMSCRALQRTVEESILAFAGRRARARGAMTLEGVYVPTKKNSLVATFYADRGFARGPDSGGNDDAGSRWVRSLERGPEPSVWVPVHEHELIA